MEILLLILKIIDIVLLVILGVALALLLYVLFFPVLYKGNFSADRTGEKKNFYGNVRLRILGLVGIYAKVDESGVNAVMKILWIKKVLAGSAEESGAKHAGNGDNDVKADAGRDKPGAEGKSADGVKNEKDNAGRDKPGAESETGSGVKKEIKNSEKSVSGANSNSESFNVSDEDGESMKTADFEPETSDKEIKKGFLERLHDRIEGLINKLSALSVILDEEKKAVELFLKRKSTKYTLERLKIKVPKLLKHILPRKLNGNLCVGFDDPSKTGYLCAVMGMIYGTYGENFDFEADFEEERFEGEVSFSGHIIPAYPVAIALSLYFSRKVRLCIGNLKLLYAESVKKLDKAKETMIN